ncbi:hypothetical protein LINPERPRIM_LOCUS26804 [Linum perenne]
MVELSNKSRRIVSLLRVLLRLAVTLLFPFFAFLFLSIFMVFVTLMSGQLSITSPEISIPSRCRIVSSGVDLRSSKVCKLGLLNHKAASVFHPFDRNKFRCRHDYYWASVFEVEYEDQSLGQRRYALAEAPSEALPHNCRPNFAAALITKHKFKVNETYNCWHRAGVSKVSLHGDDVYHCNIKEPSVLEMMNRQLQLSTDALSSLFFLENGNARYWKWEVMAGALTGFLASLFTIVCFSAVYSVMPQISVTWTCILSVLTRTINLVVLRRACFFVAYFSFMGWLTIQYGKRLGLQDIQVDYI